MPNTRFTPPSGGDDVRPAGRPCMRDLDHLVDFPVHRDGETQRYVRLGMPWSEWFYWMEALGQVQVSQTNGWGLSCRQGRFDGWQPVPGSELWIRPEDGSEINTGQLGAITVVEQEMEDGFSLSCRVRHRDGHEFLKLYLTHGSDLNCFQDMVEHNAVPQELPPDEACDEPLSAEMPARKVLWRLWRGACQVMPAETFAGLEPLARWTVLGHIGEDFARPLVMNKLGRLLEELTNADCRLRLTLFHPDHQTVMHLRPTEVETCCNWWHLNAEDGAKCHLRKVEGLRAWGVSREPGTGTTDWIEIYHRPSRRLLAWLRPEEDPTDQVRWRRALASLL